MDKQQEYLRQLGEKNRLKKMMAAKSEEELMNEEKEKGFSTHFRGAHVPKDKTPSAKFEGKPSVKVHKEPDMDLLRRLAPPVLNDQGRPVSKQDGISRRFPKFDSYDEENDDKPYVDEQPVTMEIPSRKNTAPVSNKEEQNPNMNNMLFGQINSMSEDQKMALLQMLQQNMKPSETAEQPTKEQRRRETAPGPRSGEETNYQEDLRHEKEYFESETEQQPQRIPQQGNRERESVSSRERDSVVTRERDSVVTRERDSVANRERDSVANHSENQTARSIPAQVNQSLPENAFNLFNINLKIKISSTWNLSKNASLQGIRLRSIQSNPTTMATEYVDLLQFCKYKVLLGMIPANKTSESFTSVNNLMGVGIGFKSNMWKAPISSFQSIELCFEGHVPLELMKNFSDSTEFSKSISLFVWNATQEDEDIDDTRTTNYSAVKDMDVVINEKSVWSGEVNYEKKKCEISRATDSWMTLSKNESKPSFSCNPFVPRPKTTTSARPMSQKAEVRVSLPAGDDSDGDLKGRKLLFGSPARSKLSTPFQPPLVEDSLDNDGSRPDWLQFSSSAANDPAQKKLLILTPSTKEKRLADLPKSPALEQQKQKTDFNLFSPGKTESQNVSKPSSQNKAVARRRRLKDSGSFDVEAGVLLSPNAKRTPNIKSVTELKDYDTNLRRSIEAVEHSEKFNLNRLETVVTKNKRVSHDPSVSTLQQRQDEQEQNNNALKPSESKKRLVNKERALIPDEPVPGSPDNRSKNSTMNNTMNTNPFDQSQALENRSAKIGQVNAKLNTALNDLADILAALPRQPVTEDEQRIPLKQNSSRELILEQEKLIPQASQATDSSNTKSLPVATTPAKPKTVVESTPVDLPAGKVLTFEILTTHGDASYVGLNGLEFYDRDGNNLLEANRENVALILANPMDLGALPGYSDDPRKIQNLLDGVNETKDDLHQWLAPHLRVVKDYAPTEVSDEDLINAQGERLVATLTVRFASMQTLSMIKVFNFNKSRTHNQRGVRDVRILLDGKLIFKG
jgi:hypothetical protein